MGGPNEHHAFCRNTTASARPMRRAESAQLPRGAPREWGMGSMPTSSRKWRGSPASRITAAATTDEAGASDEVGKRMPRLHVAHFGVRGRHAPMALGRVEITP